MLKLGFAVLRRLQLSESFSFIVRRRLPRPGTMKLISWNCRGMLLPTAIRELLDLQGRVKADVIFLSEFHLNTAKATELRVKLGFDRFHIVDSDGRSGGLALFYNLSNEVVLNYASPNFIDGFVMDGINVSWRLTGFYGEPNWDMKHLSWTNMRTLHNKSTGPWMIFGDFNEILVASEKEGGNIRPQQYMQNFRDCVDDCGLQEIMSIGDPFTWSRGVIRERLDRALCNEKWANIFPYAAVIHEHHVHSDHRPILLDTEYYSAVIGQKQRGERRFEARWLSECTVDEIVKSAWERAKLAGIGPSLSSRTKLVKDDMFIWDRDTLKGPKKRINKLKKELEKLRRCTLTEEVRQRIKEAQVLIENLLDQEELVWLQRGRANWLLHGDRNTSYFHKAATARKKRNCIRRLLDDTGVWKEELDDINSIITSYFKELFTSQVTVPDINVLSKVQRRVSEAMNTTLMAPYTAEEVREALFSIGDFKAPGPDGLHAVFYKRFWSMLGDDLVMEVLNAINSRVMPQGWNDTTIVMIPKVNSPEKVTQFRPISLCNVVYKVISNLKNQPHKHTYNV